MSLRRLVNYIKKKLEEETDGNQNIDNTFFLNCLITIAVLLRKRLYITVLSDTT